MIKYKKRTKKQIIEEWEESNLLHSSSTVLENQAILRDLLLEIRELLIQTKGVKEWEVEKK